MLSDFINPNFSESLEDKIIQAPVISSKVVITEQRITKLQTKHQWTNRHLGESSIPRMALHYTFCIPIVNTEVIKAASFDNEVLSHDIVIANDYKRQLLEKKN